MKSTINSTATWGRWLLALIVCTLSFDLFADDKKFLELQQDQVPLHTEQGKKWLQESTSDKPYWQLTQFYNAQPDLGTCGLATTLMILNSLPIERPVSTAHKPFRIYTADNLFTPAVNAIVTRSKVSASGMTLEQFSKILATFPVKTTRVFASDSTVDEFRKMLDAKLRQDNAHVAVNYLRSAINQQSGGHISPIGAYNKSEDRVLILDTANYKYPFVWIKTADLWHAMSVVDSESKRSRGYVVVNLPEKAASDSPESKELKKK